MTKKISEYKYNKIKSMVEKALEAASVMDSTMLEITSYVENSFDWDLPEEAFLEIKEVPKEHWWRKDNLETILNHETFGFDSDVEKALHHIFTCNLPITPSSPYPTNNKKIAMADISSCVSVLEGILCELERNKSVISIEKFSYYDKEYRMLRHKVFLEQGEVCAKCSAVPPTYLQIDHIKPVSKYPELARDKDNMQVLCVDCNMAKSNKNEVDYRENNENNN